MTNLSHNFDGERQHPKAEDFLLYVDGELSPKETEAWEAHLDVCWECRVRVAKIEETITDIVEFDQTVSQFQSTRSGAGWGNFDSLLHAAVAETENRSFIGRISDYFKAGERTRFLRFGVPVVASALIVAIVWQFVLVQPVTAAAVLQRSIEAQAKRIDETEQAVVHQRIRVRQKDVGVTWEIWNDTQNARVKQSVVPDNVVRPHLAQIVTSEGKKTPDKAVLLAESAKFDNDFVVSLRQVLRTNGMNEHRPLSAASYKAWSDSFSAKTESVVQGKDTFTITTTLEPSTQIHIAEARLTLKSSDYHPTSLYIRTAEQEFELSEQAYEIVSLKDVAPTVFADPTKVEVASTVGSEPRPLPSAIASMSPAELFAGNSNTAAPKATADLQVEVMDVLNRAGADMVEQITVNRDVGVIRVKGIVETDQRKSELLNALQTVSNNPAVRIEIQTLAEALAAEKNRPKGKTSVQDLQADSTASAAEGELIQHFGSVEAAREFARQMVNRSSRALSHAHALRRAATQFSSEEIRQLSPDGRAKWLALLQRHARSFQSETADLRTELQGVFGGGGGAGSASAVNGITELPGAAQNLLSLAQTNDRTLRSAMTISAGGPQFSAIRTPQFWASLRNAEALAARIQGVR